MFFSEKYGKLFLNYPCYHFLSGALVTDLDSRVYTREVHMLTDRCTYKWMEKRIPISRHARGRCDKNASFTSLLNKF